MVQHGSKPLKKWKWGSADKAGTEPIFGDKESRTGDVSKKMQGIAAEAMGQRGVAKINSNPHTTLRILRNSGKPYVFDLNNGMYETHEGEIIDHIPRATPVIPIEAKNG